jgi:hypothetical protein
MLIRYILLGVVVGIGVLGFDPACAVFVLVFSGLGLLWGFWKK